MTSEKDKGREKAQRRVYVLPNELVDRIVAFQEEKNYPSEVEAVRKLLDEALLHRDTASTIITRFRDRLRSLRMPAEIAKDVLVGHPLVSEMTFGKQSITFTLSGYDSYRIFEDGSVEHKEPFEKNWEPWMKSFKDEDDEIPF